jgi:hypothetical protein
MMPAISSRIEREPGVWKISGSLLPLQAGPVNPRQKRGLPASGPLRGTAGQGRFPGTKKRVNGRALCNGNARKLRNPSLSQPGGAHAEGSERFIRTARRRRTRLCSSTASPPRALKKNLNRAVKTGHSLRNSLAAINHQNYSGRTGCPSEYSSGGLS